MAREGILGIHTSTQRRVATSGFRSSEFVSARWNSGSRAGDQIHCCRAVRASAGASPTPSGWKRYFIFLYDYSCLSFQAKTAQPSSEQKVVLRFGR